MEAKRLAVTAAPAPEWKDKTARSPWSLVWTRFLRHKLALASAVVLVLLALAAVFAPLLIRHDPNATDLLNRNAGPSLSHFLGTDSFGRDVWARLLFAGRISLSVGIVAVSIYTLIGILLGSIAGYYGGFVDGLIMRFTDTVMSFPSLILIILAVSIVGPSIYNVMAVIGLLGWTGTARLVRAEFLSLREREFVTASRMIGTPNRTIMLRHILPNAFHPLIVSATLGIAGAILSEAGLSFLGLGVQPPAASWGNMLNEAQKLTTLRNYPWQWLPPGLAIAIAVLATNFLGDGLRDALDPRTRA
jgi:peptide/nickel transport system permease protein